MMSDIFSIETTLDCCKKLAYIEDFNPAKYDTVSAPVDRANILWNPHEIPPEDTDAFLKFIAENSYPVSGGIIDVFLPEISQVRTVCVQEIVYSQNNSPLITVSDGESEYSNIRITQILPMISEDISLKLFMDSQHDTHESSKAIISAIKGRQLWTIVQVHAFCRYKAINILNLRGIYNELNKRDETRRTLKEIVEFDCKYFSSVTENSKGIGSDNNVLNSILKISKRLITVYKKAEYFKAKHLSTVTVVPTAYLYPPLIEQHNQKKRKIITYPYSTLGNKLEIINNEKKTSQRNNNNNNNNNNLKSTTAMVSNSSTITNTIPPPSPPSLARSISASSAESKVMENVTNMSTQSFNSLPPSLPISTTTTTTTATLNTQNLTTTQSLPPFPPFGTTATTTQTRPVFPTNYLTSSIDLQKDHPALHFPLSTSSTSSTSSSSSALFSLTSSGTRPGGSVSSSNNSTTFLSSSSYQALNPIEISQSRNPHDFTVYSKKQSSTHTPPPPPPPPRSRRRPLKSLKATAQSYPYGTTAAVEGPMVDSSRALSPIPSVPTTTKCSITSNTFTEEKQDQSLFRTELKNRVGDSIINPINYNNSNSSRQQQQPQQPGGVQMTTTAAVTNIMKTEPMMKSLPLPPPLVSSLPKTLLPCIPPPLVATSMNDTPRVPLSLPNDSSRSVESTTKTNTTATTTTTTTTGVAVVTDSFLIDADDEGDSENEEDEEEEDKEPEPLGRGGRGGRGRQKIMDEDYLARRRRRRGVNEAIIKKMGKLIDLLKDGKKFELEHQVVIFGKLNNYDSQKKKISGSRNMATMLMDSGGNIIRNYLNYHMNNNNNNNNAPPPSTTISTTATATVSNEPLHPNPNECVVSRPPVILRGPIVPILPVPLPLPRATITSTPPTSALSSDHYPPPHPNNSTSSHHLSNCIRVLHILLSLPHQHRYTLQDVMTLTVTMIKIRIPSQFDLCQFNSTEDLSILNNSKNTLIEYCGQLQLLSAATNFKLLIKKMLPTIFDIPSNSTTTGTTATGSAAATDSASCDPRMANLGYAAGDLADIFFQIEVRHPISTEHYHNNIFEVAFQFQWYTTGFLGRGLPRELYTTGTLKAKFRDLLMLSAELHLDFDTLFNNVKFMNAL